MCSIPDIEDSWFGLGSSLIAGDDSSLTSSNWNISWSEPVLEDLDAELDVGEGTVGSGEIASGLQNVRIRAPALVMLVSDMDLDKSEMSMLLCSICSIDSIQFLSISDGTTLPATIMLNCSIPSRGSITSVSSESLDVVPGWFKSKKMVIRRIYSHRASSSLVIIVLGSNSTIQFAKQRLVLEITGLNSWLRIIFLSV